MEKVKFFRDSVESHGLSASLLSKGEQVDGASGNVLIVDLMGRLEQVYSVAHLAFVGATLVDIGGHNPLEPAMYGVPVVVGPHVSVIRDIVGEMRDACGILQVTDRAGIRDIISRVGVLDGGLQEVGMRGNDVWQRHRGASARVLAQLIHE
jgi:3-deoxy-D-manno-octulosonic-acid transferase